MTALPARKIEIVRRLVESAPDRVVGSLQQALSATPPESALGAVKAVVETEVADRNLRNIIFQPIAPLCVGGDAQGLTFPARSLFFIWRALKALLPDDVEELRADDFADPRKRIDAQDRMVAAALDGLRQGSHPDFVAAAAVADDFRGGAAEQLMACLEISAVVRRATGRLAEWIAHPGGETAAGARLAYKDSVEISDDAGPRFFHMLAAQMAQPWMIMRIISAVMDKPNERYMKDSEVSSFAEALMDEIDASIAAIAEMNLEDGPHVGCAGAQRAELAVQQILEMEASVELPRDQGWGQRVVKQRAGLAGVIEGRLKEAERLAIESLPMFAPRNQRVRHQVPLLTDMPDQRLVVSATTLLTFAQDLRSIANYGGFSSARNKLIEKLGEYIDHYVESAVDLVRADEVEDREIAAAFLETAAGYNHLIRGEKAAEITRRRAHVALAPDPQSLAS